MTGVLDRQEVIAVLDQQHVGRYLPPNPLSYRETLADALMALASALICKCPPELSRCGHAAPAPVVTDEAVEMVAAKLFPDLFAADSLIPEVLRNSGRWQRRHEVRAALEAAAPLLGPRPLLDDREVYRIVGRHDITDAVMELARPMPTAEQLDGWLTDHEKCWEAEMGDKCSCGWRPDSWDSEDEFDEYYREHRNEAVLALLNGAEA